jgi:hypothetical protein
MYNTNSRATAEKNEKRSITDKLREEIEITQNAQLNQKRKK